MKIKNIEFEGKRYVVTEDLVWWRMASIAKNIPSGKILYSSAKDIDPYVKEELVTLIEVDGKEQQFLNVPLMANNMELVEEHAKHRPQKISTRTVMNMLSDFIKASTIESKVDDELMPIKEELDALQAKLERIAKAKVEKNIYKDELEKAKKLIEELREANLHLGNENRKLKNENNALKVFKSEVTKLLETR